MTFGAKKLTRHPVAWLTSFSLPLLLVAACAVSDDGGAGNAETKIDAGGAPGAGDRGDAGSIPGAGGVGGAGGTSGSGGVAEAGEATDADGTSGSGGTADAGPTADADADAASGSGGVAEPDAGFDATQGASGCGAGRPEPVGPLCGITAAHNRVRAAVNAQSPLLPLTWSSELAAYAQEWADTTCTNPRHRANPPYGENIAWSSSSVPATAAGEELIRTWAAEKACYTPGPFMRGDVCERACYQQLHSDGCGHYTAMVWRGTTEVGCGVADCLGGLGYQRYVVCNYAPKGNLMGQMPY